MVQVATEEKSHEEAQKSQKPLTPDGDAERADVAAGVKATQGNCVLTRSEGAELDGINFVTAVGDTVVRKHWNPCRAVETRVRLFDFPCRIVDRENHAHRVAIQLRLAHQFHYRRRVVDIDRLTQSFARQLLT